MYRYLLILALLLNLGCTEQKVVDPAMKISTQEFDLEAIPGTNMDFAINNEANKRTIEEGMLQNRIKEGLWITYHDSEKMIPKSMTNYVNGKKNGGHATYNNRGGIELLQHYQNDILHGRAIIFKNGRLIEDAIYKEGELHGIKRTYFDRSDIVQTEVGFKMGVQHGFYRHFNDAGQLVMEYIYEDGKKVSGGIVEQTKTEEE